MTFQANIPATGQSLGNSRPQVLGNFTNYFNVISQDHVAPNLVNPSQGKHKKSTYVDQGSDPITAVNEIALYGKSVGASPQSELFLAREGGGAIIQMSVGNPIANINGETFLPGGLTLKWATITPTAIPQPQTITFASLGLTDFSTAGYAATSNPINSNAGLRITAISTTGFTIQGGTGTQTFYVMIIGK